MGVTGETLVRTQGGAWVPIFSIKTGDTVVCDQEGKATATVLAVVRQQDFSGQLWECRGVIITPYHPIIGRNIKGFMYSKKLPNCSIMPYTGPNTVYDIVLNEYHFLITQAGAVVTLGHGFQQNSVISHPFFGSKQVVKRLSTHPNYMSRGKTIDILYTKKDTKSGLVNDYEFEELYD